MATTESDEPSVSTEKVLKRQKKQARREAKLMLDIEAAKRDFKKAQARLEERSTTLHTLEARLEELRAQSPQAATGAEPTSLSSEETRLPEGSVVMIDVAKMDALP